MCQPDRGIHVQLVHVFLAFEIGLPEDRRRAETGIVDEQHEPLFSRQPLRNRRQIALVRQIRPQTLRTRPVPF